LDSRNTTGSNNVVSDDNESVFQSQLNNYFKAVEEIENSGTEIDVLKFFGKLILTNLMD